jgi:mannose-6-phosphate isomerase-like protein (cupin superfamily)
VTPGGKDERLAALRRRLEETEAELTRIGYRTERMVTHPGSVLSQQILEQEILILVLHGSLVVEREGESLEVAAGDRVEVPSGVAFSLRASGEGTVYWIHAQRPGTPREPATPRDDD